MKIAYSLKQHDKLKIAKFLVIHNKLIISKLIRFGQNGLNGLNGLHSSRKKCIYLHRRKNSQKNRKAEKQCP